LGYDSSDTPRVLQSDAFARWLRAVGNREARALILVRLRRLSLGHLGDVKSLGGGMMELRVHSGRGYRVYFVRRGDEIMLLCGGTKASQRRDIVAARRMAHEFEEERWRS
jgi:putative addiction module killer protein